MRYTVHEIERALACLRMFVISWSHLEHGLDQSETNGATMQDVFHAR